MLPLLMSASILLLLLYLVAQFAICYFVSRKITTEEEFLIAGRSLGTPLITLSLFATWFGAETCIGSSAEVFTHGLSGSRADPVGYSLCLLLAGIFLAPKVWNKKYVTLADVYAEQFGPRTERLAVWILALSSLIWAAAQLRAFGQVISSTTNLPVDITMFFSYLFVIAYVFYGGLLGDIITDSIQAIVIFFGLSALFFFVFRENPNIFQIITEQSAERLSIISSGETFLQRMDRWAIPILGSLVAQEVVGRLLAAKSPQVAVRSSYYAAGIYIFVGSIPIILGLVGPQIINFDLPNKEHFIIALAQHYLPIYFLPIFSGALISALLATIDSILISVSGLISHNYIIPKMKIKGEKKKVYVTRLSIMGSATVAYILAYNSDSIYSLLEMASSFGTSGILIITMYGLWVGKSKDSIALATLVVGLAGTPFYEYVLESDSPFINTIITCLVFFTLANSISPYLVPAEKKPQEILE